MLRLVDDFSRTPRWMLLAGVPLLGVIGVLGFFWFDIAPGFVEVLLIAWFLGVGGYSAIAFGRAAIRSRGITRNRMTAVTVGAVLFVGAIVILFVDALVPTADFSAVPQLLALCAGIAFFIGFAPPPWVRRAWREPDLRRFMEKSVHLTTIADDRRALMEIQHAAAAAFGASGASIGVAVEGRGLLRYPTRDGGWLEYPDDAFIAGQAFTQQRRIVTTDAGETDPDHADVYTRVAANTVISAPITSEDRRLGVLSIYAERAPIFVEDDLWLLELLADHIAILLEARKLAAVESTLRAREESARLKEEFLSAAAHDLRTPLTVVLGQAELLERRLARDPSAPPDSAGVARMAREARRLRDLVTRLLDAQRLERGATVIDRTPADLRDVVDAVRRRYHDQGIDLKLTVPDEPVTSAIDLPRFEQVIENLVENAIKYSGGSVLPEIELRADGGSSLIAVLDHGVGVPEEERERIFERFYRATNVQGLPEGGIGLGLFICRRTVEAHGGRIWVEPGSDGGSRFLVSIPRLEAEDGGGAAVEVPGWSAPGAEAVADA
jgi:signal transduction histidine kinase